jgi:hypothetical protein
LTTALQLQADWIAFIDDDEVPQQDWMVQLCAAAWTHNADAVNGVVRYKFPDDCPTWRRRKPWEDWGNAEGARLDSAGTGNVLFRASMASHLRFDESQGMLGGEDSHFFRRFHDAGGRIVLSLKPVVTETVPWSRLTLQGFIKKHFRKGIAEIEYRRMNGQRIRRSRAIRRFLRGLRILPLTPFRGLGNMLSGICMIAESAGIAWSISGRRFQYYKHVTGE